MPRLPQPHDLAGDLLAQTLPGRCRVCALPLPAGEPGDGICSQRCAGRRRDSALVLRDRGILTARLLAVVRELRDGTTLCPGELSQRILPDMDRPLTVLRPILFELAGSGRLRVTQKGVWLPWWKIRGPFRIGKSKG